MDDATSRAREVIAEMFLVGDFAAWSERGESDYKNADDTLARLRSEGLALYDTRTHAAIPREPSDEVVERVARALWDSDFPTWPQGYATNVETCRNRARAAIAALVQTQTQGGERGM